MVLTVFSSDSWGWKKQKYTLYRAFLQGFPIGASNYHLMDPWNIPEIWKNPIWKDSQLINRWFRVCYYVPGLCWNLLRTTRFCWKKISLSGLVWKPWNLGACLRGTTTHASPLLVGWRRFALKNGRGGPLDIISLSQWPTWINFSGLHIWQENIKVEIFISWSETAD